jgi:hypothetical protein
MVAGAVYATVQYVKIELLRVQLVAPSDPCPPLDPPAVLESA